MADEWHVESAEFRGFVKAKLENLENTTMAYNEDIAKLQKRVEDNEKTTIKMKAILTLVSLLCGPSGLNFLYRLTL